MSDKIDTSPEAVDDLVQQLRKDVFYGDVRLHSFSRHNPLHMHAANTLRDLSARVAELEAIYVLKRAECDGVSSMLLSVHQDCIATEARFIEQRDSLVPVTKKLAKTEAKLVEVMKKWSAAESEAYDLRAAIPRAWQMGLDAAAKACTTIIRDYDIMDSKGTKYLPLKTQKAAKSMVSLARQDIRDLTPPADLVQQATKRGE